MSRGVSRCVWSLLCLAAVPVLASAQAPGAGADFVPGYAGEVALEGAAD